jgi:hypothetical protein
VRLTNANSIILPDNFKKCVWESQSETRVLLRVLLVSVLQHFVPIAKYLGIIGVGFNAPVKSWFCATLSVRRFTNLQQLKL